MRRNSGANYYGTRGHDHSPHNKDGDDNHIIPFLQNTAVILVMSLNYGTHACYQKSHFGMVL